MANYYTRRNFFKTALVGSVAAAAIATGYGLCSNDQKDNNSPPSIETRKVKSIDDLLEGTWDEIKRENLVGEKAENTGFKLTFNRKKGEYSISYPKAGKGEHQLPPNKGKYIVENHKEGLRVLMYHSDVDLEVYKKDPENTQLRGFWLDEKKLREEGILIANYMTEEPISTYRRAK